LLVVSTELDLLETSISQAVTGKTVDIRHKLPPLEALTSIRFLAALYVAIFHTGLSSLFSQTSGLARFLRSGYTGVSFFFVLSGFILAYNYPRIRSKRKFWIARFARVYPVYFLSIVLGILMHSMRGKPQPVLSLFLVFGLVQAWWTPLFQAINAAAWTLSVEAFFYLSLPFLLPLMSRLNWKQFMTLQAAYILLVLSPVAIDANHLHHLALLAAQSMESSLPLFRMNTFLVGVFLGLQWNTLHEQRNVTSWLKMGRRYWAVTGIVGSLLLLQLAPGTLYLPIRTVGLTYSFALVILGLADSKRSLLTNHWAQISGEISYGFYILQFPVWAISLAIQKRFAPSIPFVDLVCVTLPLLACTAYVSFRWFEIPARLLIRRALTGQPVPTRPV
jgi:peptidoglycan/LPS O-acetylase OafA/YrhL